MKSINPCVALVLMTSALTLGCASAVPAVRVSPDAAEIAWAGNRASVHRISGGLRVAAALEHPDARVGVDIENGKANRLEVQSQGVALSVARVE